MLFWCLTMNRLTTHAYQMSVNELLYHSCLPDVWQWMAWLATNEFGKSREPAVEHFGGKSGKLFVSHLSFWGEYSMLRRNENNDREWRNFRRRRTKLDPMLDPRLDPAYQATTSPAHIQISRSSPSKIGFVSLSSSGKVLRRIIIGILGFHFKSRRK